MRNNFNLTKSERKFIFGQKLKQIIKLKKTKQEDVAVAVKMSPATISAMCKGNGNTEMDTYLDVIDFLKIDSNMVFEITHEDIQKFLPVHQPS